MRGMQSGLIAAIFITCISILFAVFYVDNGSSIGELFSFREMLCTAMSDEELKSGMKTAIKADLCKGCINSYGSFELFIRVWTMISFAAAVQLGSISGISTGFKILFSMIFAKWGKVPSIAFYDMSKKGEQYMYYILDHYYVKDHMNFCRVVRLDGCHTVQLEGCDAVELSGSMSMYDVAEILVAMQFYFEEKVDETENPVLDDVVKLLEKYWGFKSIDKESVSESLACVLDIESEMSYQSYDIWDFEDGACVYLDLYEVRERMCGPGQPDKLFNKWLTPEIKADIEKLRIER